MEGLEWISFDKITSFKDHQTLDFKVRDVHGVDHIFRVTREDALKFGELLLKTAGQE